MADTVDTAAPFSPADEAEKPPDAQPASPADEADGREDAEKPEGREEAAETAEEREEEAEGGEDGPSLTELLEQLGRDLSELGMRETQLEAARNMPEVRRAAHDIAGALVVVIAALTAFAFVNVAVMDGLSKVLDPWVAALLLAAFWIAVAGVLLFGFLGRARQWLLWIVLKAPPKQAVEELERERDTAAKAALRTLERVGPALAVQVAMAAVPDAGDVASGVVEIGGSVLEVSDEIVEVFADQVPAGGVVNQVWDVALMPGRLGIKVATTVLRRGRPADERSRDERQIRSAQ
jgi:hypothetical protein